MRCAECSHVNLQVNPTDCAKCGSPLSVVTDSLDALVAAASVPNLAAMFGAAKSAGLIQAQHEYGHTV